MTTPTDPPTPFRVIGTTPLRHDGVDKVTGRAQYGADLRLPGMLHGAVLRSPHAHARIRSIDTRAAEAYPGVRAVATAQDLPELESKLADLGETTINLRYQSNNLLARDKVLYFRHAVAAVAAVNAHVATAAPGLPARVGCRDQRPALRHCATPPTPTAQPAPPACRRGPTRRRRRRPVHAVNTPVSAF